jgi:hypothetical protein
MAGGFLFCCTAEPPDFQPAGGDDDGGDDDDSIGPSSSQVIFTEIMANPARVSDPDGEWIELYNTGLSEASLEGWTIVDASGTSITLTGLNIGARAYAVLASNGEPAENGGVSVSLAYEGLTLGNDEESLTLADGSGEVKDAISWTRAPEGASLSLDPKRYDATSNDDASNFCASKYTRMEDGDYGTPGSANDVCFVEAAAGDLVITEIMANPKSVDDAVGEWIEIYNASSSTIKLDGWVIADSVGDKHTISSGATLEIKAGALLVLGNHSESTENGGVTLNYSWGSDIILDDLVGPLKLIAGSTEVDVVDYGGDDFPPMPEGASLQLDPSAESATSNDDGANWCVSTKGLSGGDAGTPGSSNPPCGS